MISSCYFSDVSEWQSNVDACSYLHVSCVWRNVSICATCIEPNDAQFLCAIALAQRWKARQSMRERVDQSLTSSWPLHAGALQWFLTHLEVWHGPTCTLIISCNNEVCGYVCMIALQSPRIPYVLTLPTHRDRLTNSAAQLAQTTHHLACCLNSFGWCCSAAAGSIVFIHDRQRSMAKSCTCTLFKSDLVWLQKHFQECFSRLVWLKVVLQLVFGDRTYE